MAHRLKKWIFLPALLVAGILLLGFSVTKGQADTSSPGVVLAGSVFDRQGQVVQGATVTIQSPGGSGQDTGQGEEEAGLQAVTQADGSYLLSIPEKLHGDELLVIKRAHFKTVEIPLTPNLVERLNAGGIRSYARCGAVASDQPGILDRHAYFCDCPGINCIGLAA